MAFIIKIWNKILNINFWWLVLVLNLPLVLNWILYYSSKDSHRSGFISSFWFQLCLFLIMNIFAAVKPAKNILSYVLFSIIIILNIFNLVGALFATNYSISSRCDDFKIYTFVNPAIKSSLPDKIFIETIPYLLYRTIDFEYDYNLGSPSGGPFNIKLNSENLSKQEKDNLNNCYTQPQELDFIKTL